MGVRPSWKIIVGIDDAEPLDRRRTSIDEDFQEYLEDILNFRDLKQEEYWKSPEDPDMFDDYYQTVVLQVPGMTRFMSDLVYNPELAQDYPYIGNVTGLVIHRGRHDDWFIRALALFDEKWMRSGYERIPVIEDIDPESFMFRRMGYNLDDIKCNRVVSGIFESMPSISRHNWQRAIHYLGLLGWNLTEEDLRYILVWTWA